MRSDGPWPYDGLLVKRSLLLRALLALALVAPVAGCGEGSADEDAVDAIARAADLSAGTGSRFKIDGTVEAQGRSIAMTGRASVEPGGRQGIVKMTVAGTELETYIDGRYLLVGADALPSTAGLPPGTRYLRLNVDKIGASVGIDSGPLRKLQSLDPGAAARMAAAASDIHSIGKATEDGVAVTRYEWSATFEEIAGALGGAGTATDKLPRALRDTKLTSVVAIDGDGRVHSFSIRTALSGAKMSMKTTVTSYSDDISVDVPSGRDVYDVTDAVAGGLGDLDDFGG